MIDISPTNPLVTKTKLTKISACSCGFPILRKDITIGTAYSIVPALQTDITLICGGCGKQTRLQAVWALGKDGGNPGWLPLDIFSPAESDEVTIAV